MKSIIRWVGGKTKLLTYIRDRLPVFDGTYYEPFIGGGAVLFDIMPSNAIVSDKNDELINFYNQVKTNPVEVNCLVSTFDVDKDSYLKIRSWDREPGFYQRSVVERAARFFYLNKTSFQGMWRVNAKGQNNVPFGQKKKVDFNEESLCVWSHAIQNIEFRCDDFENVLSEACSGDFVYLDPPYVPLSETSGFTTYTSTGFTMQDQQRLCDCCDDLDSRGVKFLLSNSGGAAKKLYAKFVVEEISVKRTVSAKSSSRGNVTEILVKNY